MSPRSKFGYSSRGICKFKLKNYKEAIKDFTVDINSHSNDRESYYYRGLSKIALKDISGGCKDLKKAKELGYEEANKEIKKHCN